MNPEDNISADLPEPSKQRRRYLAWLGLAPSVLATKLSFAQGEPVKKLPSNSFIEGREYWVNRKVDAQNIRLFLWRKRIVGNTAKGVILFIHGSSMAGTPTFDLQILGKPEYSAMDTFARLGYDTWSLDHEGYGRSDKGRQINFNIANGIEDLEAVIPEILKLTGQSSIMLYGVSSGSLRAAGYAQLYPRHVSRIALDAFVWTGEGSPTLADRRKRIAQWESNNRRPVDKAMISSVFTRDHPGTADPAVVDAFANAILALDSSMPTGTYYDMSVNLPVIDPEKMVMPTLIMRGQYDGIAGFQDLLNFFAKIPSPDKQFSVMPGIAHASFQERNVAIAYHVLDGFFSQPKPVYRG
jgi:pimeloyl-ACP methyl ester carboxylesterase